MRTGAAATGAEEIAEDIGEDFLEALAEVETTEAARSARRALERRMAETIILRALLGIGEDLVGLVDQFEIIFGFFVAGIAIGMVLNRELAVGFFQLVVGSPPRDG